MKSWAGHPVRVTIRLLRLAGELLLAAFDYGLNGGFRSKALPATARAEWLQRSSRRLLRLFNIDLQVIGPVPTHGLLVCNHLSYLDILALGALSPAVFIAKIEVKDWPVFGWFARLAGTIFVDRNRPSRARQSTEEIALALRNGALVVLFAEGTSSGGDTVLPFKSSLLEPATDYLQTLTAGHIHYALSDGNASEEVCYWKDMTLVPHLINLLGKRAVAATIALTEFRTGSANRKELARQLHQEVLSLRQLVIA